MRWLLVLAVAAVFWPGQVRADSAMDECDRLAASSVDPDRKAAPVEFEALDGVAAETACRAAIATNAGVPRLAYQLARALDAQDRYDEARASYQAAIDAGYRPALLGLGKLEELGLGGDANYARAQSLYREALDKGLPFAAGDLGYLYEQGLGVQRDAGEAARLYAIAVDAGDPWAEVSLAALYETGDGVAEDAARAAALYRSAAEKGNPVGQFNVGMSYLSGPARDDLQAKAWLERATAQEYAPAYLALGRLHRYGIESLRDPAEAERLFLIAVFSGDDDASWRAAAELARMWANAGERLDEAEEMISQALASAAEDDPERPMVLDTAALVAYKAGDETEALRLQLLAVDAAPDSAPIQDRLGDIYAALGKTADARAAWEKALSLPPPANANGWDRDAVTKKLGAT